MWIGLDATDDSGATTFNYDWCLYPRTAKFNGMIQAGKAVGLALSGLLFCEGAFAITPDSSTNATPYQSIVDRNVFGLKPPPPPAEAPPPAKPPVNITLTGITSLGGTKRAFMSL